MRKKKRRLPYALRLLIALSAIVAALVGAAIFKATVAIDILLIMLVIYAGWAMAFSIIRDLSRDYWIALINYISQVFFLVSWFGGIYARTGLLDSNGLIVTGKPVHQYFSVLAWVGASYGDFRPTQASRPWVLLETLLGYFFLAIFFILLVLVFEKTRKQPKRKRPYRKRKLLFMIKRAPAGRGDGRSRSGEYGSPEPTAR